LLRRWFPALCRASSLRLQSQKQIRFMADSDMISTHGVVSRKITFPYNIFFCVPLSVGTGT
jgi:hypothetical protein